MSSCHDLFNITVSDLAQRNEKALRQILANAETRAGNYARFWPALGQSWRRTVDMIEQHMRERGLL